MFCPFCGTEITEIASFCPECGSNIADFIPDESSEELTSPVVPAPNQSQRAQGQYSGQRSDRSTGRQSSRQPSGQGTGRQSSRQPSGQGTSRQSSRQPSGQRPRQTVPQYRSPEPDPGNKRSPLIPIAAVALMICMAATVFFILMKFFGPGSNPIGGTESSKSAATGSIAATPAAAADEEVEVTTPLPTMSSEPEKTEDSAKDAEESSEKEKESSEEAEESSEEEKESSEDAEESSEEVPTVTPTPAKKKKKKEETPTEEPTVTPTPTKEPTKEPTPTPTPTPQPTPAQRMITCYGGIQAPASDFLFPDSSTSYISWAELDARYGSMSDIDQKLNTQTVINEMFARYGYTFSSSKNTAEYIRNRVSGKSWYQQVQAICPIGTSNDWYTLQVNYMNAYERENIKTINAWQDANIPPDV